VLSLYHAICPGADSIDDADVLRAGGTEALLGHRAMAPSTLGTFLRASTSGHVRPLDRVLGESLRRAWAAGRAPARSASQSISTASSARCTAMRSRTPPAAITGELGYDPLLATRAGSGEALHVSLREGSAALGRGALRFISELLARVRHAGSPENRGVAE
jgi:hypothetical protein